MLGHRGGEKVYDQGVIGQQFVNVCIAEGAQQVLTPGALVVQGLVHRVSGDGKHRSQVRDP